ncbi:outer membrane protein TolC [Oxalobacteraceae bacterium GrIS 2.11]
MIRNICIGKCRVRSGAPMGNYRLAQRCFVGLFTISLVACNTVQPREMPHLQKMDLLNKSTQSEFSAAKMINWWQQFGDPVLVRLVESGLRDNDDFLSTLEKVKQSKIMAKLSMVNRLPTVEVNNSITSQRRSLNNPQSYAPSNAPRNSTSYMVDGQFGWELDLFGRRDAADYVAVSNVEQSEAESQAMRLAIVSDIAKNTLTARMIQRRIDLANEAIAINGQLVDIAQAKYQGGLVSESDVQTKVDPLGKTIFQRI